MPSDADFLQVALNENEPTACSPSEDDPNWRGILINAPENIYLSVGDDERVRKVAFGSTPICGYSLLDVLETMKAGPMRIVAVDTATGDEYSGEIDFEAIDPDTSIPPDDEDDEPLDEEELEGVASGGYFNPNLHSFVDLPREPGSYEVTVVQGERRSNTVRINVRD